MSEFGVSGVRITAGSFTAIQCGLLLHHPCFMDEKKLFNLSKVTYLVSERSRTFKNSFIEI